jgi:hypothetical protein
MEGRPNSRTYSVCCVEKPIGPKLTFYTDYRMPKLSSWSNSSMFPIRAIRSSANSYALGIVPNVP